MPFIKQKILTEYSLDLLTYAIHRHIFEVKQSVSLMFLESGRTKPKWIKIKIDKWKARGKKFMLKAKMQYIRTGCHKDAIK